MEFKSKKSFWIGIIVLSVCTLLIFIIITTLINDTKHWFYLLPLFVPLSLLIWIWFDTGYKIESNFLKYKSGFLKGSIDIIEIKEIITNTTSFVGIKPALASNGLIIKFKKWDEIYVSPANQDLFNQELLKINPNIKIVN